MKRTSLEPGHRRRRHHDFHGGGWANLESAAVSMDTKPAETAVKIDNFVFSPNTLTVAAGSTIHWTNHDDIPHNVVSEDKSFKSKVMDTDEDFCLHVRQARHIHLLLLNPSQDDGQDCGAVDRMNPFDLKSVLFARHAQHVVLIHFPIALFLAGVAFDFRRPVETRHNFCGGGVLQHDAWLPITALPEHGLDGVALAA